jgi:hypothetical protein
MHMPFEDNSFDAIYQIDATCHAPDQVGCYKVWRRLACFFAFVFNEAPLHCGAEIIQLLPSLYLQGAGRPQEQTPTRHGVTHSRCLALRRPCRRSCVC